MAGPQDLSHTNTDFTFAGFLSDLGLTSSGGPAQPNVLGVGGEWAKYPAGYPEDPILDVGFRG